MPAETSPESAGRKGRPTGRRSGSSGRASSKGRTTPGSRVGRYTPPEQGGRYTAPIPRDRRKSPAWFGVAILVLLILGVLTILLNYLGVLPHSVSSWYLVAGLVLILVGFLMATRYR